MSRTEVYLNVREISEVHEKKVLLKDVAELWCGDSHLAAKLNALTVKVIKSDRNWRYVESVLDLIRLIRDVDPSVQINSIGQVNYIIDYHKPEKKKYVREWLKTGFVCLVCFFGAAFAIMTFNNDVDVTKVFGEIYFVVTGKQSDGFTILELSYSLGLAVGIIGFFNHFSRWKINTDPTPLEVEMRLYEDNISKTLIQNADRKESGTDVT
ncbi:MAG TPA: stage V sporulation protein AA [Candidatus Lachnoclostridium stercorigallinarum]|uniref:Stage V sporulation protein AA n=1 Tax=Candidatus Lachnoclostridium stercorigallinarum TaxID=2838634 RepID=A0A9D2K468_9FIRM|nr:stage V sporulation protein AA [Candidatus Lachnoclostridium stercorigallinarum]